MIATAEKKREEFGECWAAIEEGGGSYEHELRQKIEGAGDQCLDSSVCDYLKSLVRGNPFFIHSKGLAIKLLGDIERRWKHKDKSEEENARKLRKCVLSLLAPYLESVPPRMRIRIRIQLWNRPQPIPEHGTAPAVGYSIDAITGEIHRRFYGTNRHPIPLSPIIFCGLTIICQPFRYGDEPWTQENCQGGDMYSEIGTLGVNERAERVLAAVSPKPRPP